MTGMRDYPGKNYKDPRYSTIFPISYFSLCTIKKESLIVVFWQGMWVPDGIKYGAKNSPVQGSLLVTG